MGRRLREAGVTASIGSTGDAYDKALAESFFGTLECELLERTRFPSRQAARMVLFEWLETWYNRRRRHSSLEMLAPIEFERRWQQQQAAISQLATVHGSGSTSRTAPSSSYEVVVSTGKSDCTALVKRHSDRQVAPPSRMRESWRPTWRSGMAFERHHSAQRRDFRDPPGN